MGVHILHLVEDWRTALAEARRVLTPDGFLLLGYEHSAPDDPASEIRRAWFDFVAGEGVTLPTRTGTWGAIEAELVEGGAYTSVYRAAHWVEEMQPATLLEEMRNRVFSHSWDVPDDVLATVHARMSAWVRERYGSLDTEIRSEPEFLLTVTRFPGER